MAADGLDVPQTERVDRCALCGSSGSVVYRGLTDQLFGVPGTWSLTQCANEACGLIWQDPRIVEAELGKAYRTYYTHAEDSAPPGTAAAGRQLRCFLFLDRWLSRLADLEKERTRFSAAYLDDRKPGRLIDVGCGAGYFARGMRDLGWQVCGTEVDAVAARNARENFGIEVGIGQLADLRYASESFDAVTLRHVIEHVPAPVELIRECWRILRPGGRLVVITPNAASLGHRIYRANWRGLEPPRHLFLFAPDSMSAVASRCGLDRFNVFTTAQGASYLLRSSERIRVGSFDSPRSWGRTVLLYWMWTLREIAGIRRGWGIGEELVMVADKSLE